MRLEIVFLKLPKPVSTKTILLKAQVAISRHKTCNPPQILESHPPKFTKFGLFCQFRVHAKGVVLSERACFCLLSTF